jgi:hypothetical protein
LEGRTLDDTIKCCAINSKSCSLRSAKLVPITVVIDVKVEDAGRWR